MAALLHRRRLAEELPNGRGGVHLLRKREPAGTPARRVPRVFQERDGRAAESLFVDSLHEGVVEENILPEGVSADLEGVA